MSDTDELRQLYLELIKNSLTGLIYEDKPQVTFPIWGFVGLKPERFLRKWREWGRDAPSQAHTMIGLRRMSNIQYCVERVLAENVPGDLIETGVWRGGATIFMRAILKAYHVLDRVVWVADSFTGLPTADLEKYPIEAKLNSQAGQLSVSLDQVQHHFQVYDLLDDQVRFLKGWFKDTLPTAPIERLAVMRLDGDLYQSTIEALTYLYPKLSPGGYAILDDYFVHDSCRSAVEDYRTQNGITEEIVEVDGNAGYWRRHS
jgi:hypothetical protein